MLIQRMYRLRQICARLDEAYTALEAATILNSDPEIKAVLGTYLIGDTGALLGRLRDHKQELEGVLRGHEEAVLGLNVDAYA